MSGPVVSRISAVSSAASRSSLRDHLAVKVAVALLIPAALIGVGIELQRGVAGGDDVPDLRQPRLPCVVNLRWSGCV